MSLRTQRVADLVLHETARIIQDKITDPRIGFVTLTAADISPDLRNARIFYTVMGEDADLDATAKGLKSAKPFIRKELARVVKLKNVPALRFEYDYALVRGDRVMSLLEGEGE